MCLLKTYDFADSWRNLGKFFAIQIRTTPASAESCRPYPAAQIRRRRRNERSIRQNRYARLDESFRFIGRKADAFEETGFSPQQDVAAQIAKVDFDTPRPTFPAAKNGRTDFDGLDFISRQNNCMKENPGLQFDPVTVNAVLLPETPGCAFRRIEWSVVHNKEALSL